MELLRMQNIVALKTEEKVLGFHLQNLQIAELSPESWDALSELQLRHKNAILPSSVDQSAMDQLLEWNQDLLLDEEAVSESVVSLKINVTQICNLHCQYCFAGGDGTYSDPVKNISVEKTIPQLFSFIDRVPEKGTFHLTFFGGEPLLYPEGIKLLASAARERSDLKKISLKFSIITNGTLFSESNLNLLAALKADINVSLDGPPEINDISRPTKSGGGSTQKVVSGLRDLTWRRHEFGTIGVTCVYTEAHAGKDLCSTYEFFRDLNLDYFNFSFDMKSRSRALSSSYMHAMKKIANLAYLQGGEAGLRKVTFFNRLFSILDSRVKTKNYCTAGKSLFHIDARNRTFACPTFADDPKNTVGHGQELWPDKLQEYANPLVETNNCNTCWARHLCGGGCMTYHFHATGNRHIADDLFCERFRFLAAVSFIYYEKCRVQTDSDV